LSDNHVSSGEVGASANSAPLSNRASRVCWIGKPGGAVANRSWIEFARSAAGALCFLSEFSDAVGNNDDSPIRLSRNKVPAKFVEIANDANEFPWRTTVRGFCGD
jgi:hypothetical protein